MRSLEEYRTAQPKRTPRCTVCALPPAVLAMIHANYAKPLGDKSRSSAREVLAWLNDEKFPISDAALDNHRQRRHRA